MDWYIDLVSATYLSINDYLYRGGKSMLAQSLDELKNLNSRLNSEVASLKDSIVQSEQEQAS